MSDDFINTLMGRIYLMSQCHVTARSVMEDLISISSQFKFMNDTWLATVNWMTRRGGYMVRGSRSWFEMRLNFVYTRGHHVTRSLWSWIHSIEPPSWLVVRARTVWTIRLNQCNYPARPSLFPRLHTECCTYKPCLVFNSGYVGIELHATLPVPMPHNQILWCRPMWMVSTIHVRCNSISLRAMERQRIRLLRQVSFDLSGCINAKVFCGNSGSFSPRSTLLLAAAAAVDKLDRTWRAQLR
jgi:hypothetical protein